VGQLWFVDCVAQTLPSLNTSGFRGQKVTFADDTPRGLGILPDSRVVVLMMFRKLVFSYSARPAKHVGC